MRMQGIFGLLLIGAMGLTLLVLLVGVGSFAFGGKFNQKYSNKLMRLRVLCQGLAVILFAVFMFLSSQ